MREMQLFLPHELVNPGYSLTHSTLEIISGLSWAITALGLNGYQGREPLLKLRR